MSTHGSLFPVMVFAAVLLGACATPSSQQGANGPEETSQEGGEAEQVVTSIDSYRLGQGDRIAIQVFDEPDLTMEATVGASGIINYSYLGDLQVAGRTPVELERTIADTLREGYLVNPSVNVSVVGFRSFFINGEVRSPGSYPYQPGLTLNKAIALAGGLILLDRRKVLKRGQILPLWILGYGALRFAIESMRTDFAFEVLNIRINHWISGIAVVVGLLWFLRMRSSAPDDIKPIESFEDLAADADQINADSDDEYEGSTSADESVEPDDASEPPDDDPETDTPKPLFS